MGTTTCHGLEWDLPYFVPFKWKCNGGAPYCIPGKTKRSGRNSCSHQLCECDREFAMCLHKHLPCPSIKAACLTQKANFIKRIIHINQIIPHQINVLNKLLEH